MKDPIKTTPEELAELLARCGRYCNYSDMETGRKLYNDYMEKFAVSGSPVFTFDGALGAILRIGYILGQRSERARKAAHQASDPTAPLIEKATRELAQQYHERLDKQAAERREQQEFERGLKLGAMLNEYMSAGGSISKLLELIAQVDTATEQAKGGVIYAG